MEQKRALFSKCVHNITYFWIPSNTAPVCAGAQTPSVNISMSYWKSKSASKFLSTEIKFIHNLFHWWQRRAQLLKSWLSENNKITHKTVTKHYQLLLVQVVLFTIFLSEYTNKITASLTIKKKTRIIKRAHFVQHPCNLLGPHKLYKQGR